MARPVMKADVATMLTPASSSRVTTVCRRSWNRQETPAAVRAVVHATFQLVIAFLGTLTGAPEQVLLPQLPR